MPDTLVKLVLIVLSLISVDAKAFEWFPERTTATAEQTFDGYGNPIKPFSSTPHYSVFDYGGHLYDLGTGLIYLRHRFLDPALGRNRPCKIPLSAFPAADHSSTLHQNRE